MTTIQVCISSVTGNTRRLANALIQELNDRGYDPEVMDVGDALKNPDLTDAPIVILCFWCRKAGLDDLSGQYLRRLSGRQVLAFGTMGSYTQGSYADSVRKNVSTCISENNHVGGIFLCRGKIDPERTRKRRKLPRNHPHYLNDQAYRRHLSSRSHPDPKDLEDAREALKKMLDQIVP